MGDGCWFSITIKKKDIELFTENFEPANEYGADEENSFKELIIFTFHEANYGFYSELESLSQTSLQFYGSHGSGGSYGPSEFASDGVEFATVETGHEGGYVCNFNTDGTPEESTFSEIQKYLKISDRAEKYINKKEEFLTLRKKNEPCNI